MLAWSVVALIISGASGETTPCAAGPDIDQAYCEDAQSGDSASLLQLKAMEHVHRESDDVAALRSASSTRRCAEGAYSPVVGDCSFDDWSDWGTCSATCGVGERSRDRTVSSGTCDGACLKEAETCNSENCPDDTCPPGTVPAWGSDCPDNGPSEVTTTPAPFCDENGMTASGKKCEGKIKTKISTSRITRPCQTASGDDCEGEFQIKYRDTYEDKDGEWVKFKREMSRDGGKTWKPLPLLLSELERSSPVPPECCVPTPSSTPAPIAPTLPPTTPGPTSPPVSLVSGTVKDAKYNSAIPGAKVQIQSLEATTDSVGQFSFSDAKAGQAILTATAENYADYREELKIEEGMSEISIKMVKPAKPGEWTIVMTWEKLPKDLELTTRFGACYIAPAPGQGGDAGIWNEAKTDCTDPASETEAEVDIDNYNKQGTGRSAGDTPETTTLTNVNDKTGRIVVRVDNYELITNFDYYACKPADSRYKGPEQCGPIADSKAKVEVHGPDTEKTFTVEKDGVASDDGKFWYVCSIDGKTGIVSPCKSVADCE